MSLRAHNGHRVLSCGFEQLIACLRQIKVHNSLNSDFSCPTYLSYILMSDTHPVCPIQWHNKPSWHLGQTLQKSVGSHTVLWAWVLRERVGGHRFQGGGGHGSESGGGKGSSLTCWELINNPSWTAATMDGLPTLALLLLNQQWSDLLWSS